MFAMFSVGILARGIPQFLLSILVQMLTQIYEPQHSKPLHFKAKPPIAPCQALFGDASQNGSAASSSCPEALISFKLEKPVREAVHGPQDTVDTKEHDSGRVARLIDLLPKSFYWWTEVICSMSKVGLDPMYRGVCSCTCVYMHAPYYC